MSKKELYITNEVIDKINPFVKVRYEIDKENKDYKKSLRTLEAKADALKQAIEDIKEDVLTGVKPDEKNAVLDALKVREDYATYNDSFRKTLCDIAILGNIHKEKMDTLKQEKADALSVVPDLLAKTCTNFFNGDITFEIYRENIATVLDGFGFGKVHTADSKPLDNFMKFISPAEISKRGADFIKASKADKIKEMFMSIICQYIKTSKIGFILDADITGFIPIA